MKTILVITAFLIISLSPVAFSHEGDLDEFGGHFVYGNNGNPTAYHFHKDKRAKDKKTVDTLLRSARVNRSKKDYERAAMLYYLANDYENSIRYFKRASRDWRNPRVGFAGARQAAVKRVLKKRR